MKTREEYIDLIKSCADTLRNRYMDLALAELRHEDELTRKSNRQENVSSGSWRSARLRLFRKSWIEVSGSRRCRDYPDLIPDKISLADGQW